MAEAIDTQLAGEVLRLYADRALYWPARRRLFVADVHLGKDDAFRAAGIAVPTGGTRHDLDRLTALLEHSGASSLWVLGDLLHGPRVTAAWRDEWMRFLERHAHVEVLLIEGNHDRAAVRAALGVPRRADGVVDGPFVFSHAPAPASTGDMRFRICGHVHPVARLHGLRGRFPAFALSESQLILPAFSAFTGGVPVRQALALYACAGGHIVNTVAPV